MTLLSAMVVPWQSKLTSLVVLDVLSIISSPVTKL